MSIFARILSTLVIAAFVVGPVGAATTAGAPTTLAVTTNSAPGGIAGTVKDESGLPVAGATITAKGIQTLHATSDAKGAFEISGLPAGVYLLSAEKPGFQSATETDFVVLEGAVANVAITLQTATFTSLRTIATVRSAGRGSFNTSPASVSVVTNQTFINQGATGLASVLNEVPGLQVSLPNNDGNGAAPGAITFANIRNGLGFETATLIDGHPLSVGKYGDYVLSFWTPYMFQSYDTVKGPGADAPQTNYAINGTLNLRTLDPTQEFESHFTAGGTSTGGTYLDALYSGTENRLGFVASIAEVNDPSVLTNTRVYIGNLDGGVAHINGTTDVLTYNDTLSPIPGTSAATWNNFQLLSCCYTLGGSIDKLNELLKLHYRFSAATTATVSYLGDQTTSDQNGNTSQYTPSTFQPGAGYSGPTATGTTYLTANVYPGGDVETNNEPMFQGEISTALGNDTILARYYHASIYRLLNEGNSNYQSPVTLMQTLNGTNEYGQMYKDVTVPVDWYNYYAQNEIDKLTGIDFQYQHPFGLGNALTASFSHTISTTEYWYQQAATVYNQTTNQFAGVTMQEPNVTIPEGSGEVFNTIRLTDNQNFGEKLNMLLSLYDNIYSFTAATVCGSGASSTAADACEVSGANASFRTTNPTHFDERLGLTYRQSSDLIFRFAAGSSIAPPYINLLSKFTSLPSCSSKPCTVQQLNVPENNPNLVPETAFGYDLGADYRMKQVYHLSVDIYETNLFNQFLATTVYGGLCTNALYPNSGCGAPGSGYTPPIFYDINANVNNSRYEGIELALSRSVPDGFGFIVQGSTQRGYAYNLGSNFYCSFGSTKAMPCIPANYNQNLAVVNGQNFNGGSSLYFHSGFCPGTNPSTTTYWCATANNVSNQAVPYLSGYAEINWQNSKGWYASFGSTLFGKNNSYNEPPFTIARFSLRAPISSSLSLQLSGNNIFNTYSQVVPVVAGGVAIPLANGGVAPTNGNVYGPAIWSLEMTKLFGAAY